jgi:hypothetical protein
MCTPYQNEYTLLARKSFSDNVRRAWKVRIRRLHPPLLAASGVPSETLSC